MKSLSGLIGKIERFFLNYLTYLNAQNIVYAYNHNKRYYFGLEVSEDLVDDARTMISLWKNKKL